MSAGSKKHHYVPRFLLKNFLDETNRLFVFDKSKGIVFESNADDAGHQNNFNAIEIDSEKINLEHLYNEIDTSGSLVIAKILKQEHAWTLSRVEMEILARFVAAQYLRTPRPRKQINDFNNELIDFVKGSAENEMLSNMRRMSEADIKIIALSSLQEIDEYASMILERNLVVAKTDELLYISDNPIKLYNPRPGKLPGLKVIGTDIYFPIASNRILCFMCESVRPILLQNIISLKRERKKVPQEMKSLFLALVEQRINQFNNVNTEFCNHLQVKSSSRFIYARSKDFHLAKEMTEENPNLKLDSDTYSIGGQYFPNLPKGEVIVISFTKDKEEVFEVNILPYQSAIRVQILRADLFEFLTTEKSTFYEIDLYKDRKLVAGTKEVYAHCLDKANRILEFRYADPVLDQMMDAVRKLRNQNK